MSNDIIPQDTVPFRQELEDLVTIEIVAAYLKVKPRTVRVYISQGLPINPLSPKTLRFYLSEVEAWVKGRKEQVVVAS